MHGATVERSRVTGSLRGILSAAGLTTVKDSLVRLTGTVGAAIRAEIYANSGDTNMIVDGATVVTPASLDTTGVTVSTLPAPDESVHLTLANSVIRGPHRPPSTEDRPLPRRTHGDRRRQQPLSP